MRILRSTRLAPPIVGTLLALAPGAAIAADECPTVTPHASYFIPQYFSSVTRISDDGGYFYRSDYGGAQCNFFVVDYLMGTYSNNDGNPAWNPGVRVSGAAYDLPSSSASPSGTMPATQLDCSEYRHRTHYYRKNQGQSSFTIIGWADYVGLWSGGTCYPFKSAGTANFPITIYQSAVGTDHHRFATYVWLRASGQQAKITAADPPPL